MNLLYSLTLVSFAEDFYRLFPNYESDDTAPVLAAERSHHTSVIFDKHLVYITNFPLPHFMNTTTCNSPICKILCIFSGVVRKYSLCSITDCTKPFGLWPITLTRPMFDQEEKKKKLHRRYLAICCDAKDLSKMYSLPSL